MSSIEIPEAESMTVEFKSDRGPLKAHDLALAAVCLTNSQGGTIYLGVEKDGEVTGLNRQRGNPKTGLEAAIANNTVPPLSVRVRLCEAEGKRLAAIEVPRSTRLIGTGRGTYQHRRLQVDGTPQCVPLQPHDLQQREADLGHLDLSDLPVKGAGSEVLDPVERDRLRQAIERYHGDRSLLVLDDGELDAALGLVRRVEGERVPTLTGLLLVGREDALRDHLPGHEVAFQVLDGQDVRVNDFHRLPLVRLFERIDESFRARLVEEELLVGLFRVPVPQVDPTAFREAVVNALTHRDYTRTGAVHIQWRDEELSVSNPGGFVDGVRADNLLTVEPTPRNPRLADAFKRIGLAERTGRGVDRIYQGLLRFGRPVPDYSRSDARHVVVDLSCTEADLAFLGVVIEEERRTQGALPVEWLIALSLLRNVRRADVQELAAALQREPGAARKVVEGLVEEGLVQAHGIKKGRTYTLAPSVYRRLGDAPGYVRQAGFDDLQQEQMVLRFAEEHGSIRRADVIELCRLSPDQASRLLRRLADRSLLDRHGTGKGTRYKRSQCNASALEDDMSALENTRKKDP